MYTVALSKEDLFLVLGKIFYAIALNDAKFEGEDDLPTGVEEAQCQLEVAKEVLLQLLAAPVDLSDEFVAYVKEEYEIELELVFAVHPPSEVDAKPKLYLVPKSEPTQET